MHAQLIYKQNEIQYYKHTSQFSLVLLFYCRSEKLPTLQSSQVKRTPQESINELIIWKMNPLVVGVK